MNKNKTEYVCACVYVCVRICKIVYRYVCTDTHYARPRPSPLLQSAWHVMEHDPEKDGGEEM